MPDQYQQYSDQLGQYTRDQQARFKPYWGGSTDYAKNFPSYQAWQGGSSINDAYNGRSYGNTAGTGSSGGSATPAGSYNQGAANAAAGTPGYADPTNGLTGQARVDASRGQVFANTEGRGQATMSDPYTQAALDRFKSVASGGSMPYDDTTKNAMLTSASNASAAAEGSQAQMLQQQMAMNGGTISDPSSVAAMRELAANRQGANQNSLNSINMTANRENFAAQNEGASNLASVRSNQNAQANQMYLAGAGFRAQDYATRESPGGGMNMTGSGMMGNQGYNPSPMPNITSGASSSLGQAPAGNASPKGPSYYAGNGAHEYNPTTSPVSDPTAGQSPATAAQAQPGQGPADYYNQLGGGGGSNPMGMFYGSGGYGNDYLGGNVMPSNPLGLQFPGYDADQDYPFDS